MRDDPVDTVNTADRVTLIALITHEGEDPTIPTDLPGQVQAYDNRYRPLSIPTVRILRNSFTSRYFLASGLFH